MAKTKRHLVYFINKANKTCFHLVSFISGPTLAITDKGVGNTKGRGVIKENPAITDKGLVNANKKLDTKGKVNHLLAPAITDKGRGNTKGSGVTKENHPPINVSYKGINNIHSNNNSIKPNSIKGIKGTCFDNTLSVEQNITNMSKRYNEILKGNKHNSGIKKRWGRKINPDKIKRDKEGLGIKYTKLSLS